MFVLKNNYTYDNVCVMLRGARQAQGLTQKKACEKYGISQAYLSAMETGAKPVNIDLLERVYCDAIRMLKGCMKNGSV